MLDIHGSHGRLFFNSHRRHRFRVWTPYDSDLEYHVLGVCREAAVQRCLLTRGQGSGVKLSETAMLIYVYIKSHSGDGVRLRDIQRAMKFASPSTALFHLQKLESAGLVEKDTPGNYRIKSHIRVGLIRNFLFIKSVLIPRHVFHAAATTVVSVLYFLLLREFLFSPIALLALLLNVASATAFWYEAWQDWKAKPRFS